VSVQAELDSPRCVAAYPDEERTEVFVINVEIVVVDVDRLVTVELELSVDLPPLKAFTASRNFSVICRSTTGEGIGLPS
jgi:hypothetical protein